ncbi:MAG: hypothetical protein WBB40_06460 [Psychrobacter alimentarius]
MDLATKVSKKISMPGYVINKEILLKVDEIAINTVKTDSHSDLEVFYSLRDEDHSEKQITNILGIDQLCKNTKKTISSVILKYEVVKQAGLTISFQDDGEVEVSGYSQAVDFDYRIDQIIRELKRCEQDYNWLESNFAVSDKLKRLLLRFLSLLFLTLVALSLFMFYAKGVGVDISDARLVPQGNTYYKEVENAIIGGDVTKKLDTLLMGQLKGFSNVTDIITRTSVQIKYVSIVTTIVLILFLAVKNISKLYPLAYFEFGDFINNLIKIKRKREIWGVVVILGFLVNITAGMLVAILM